MIPEYNRECADRQKGLKHYTSMLLVSGESYMGCLGLINVYKVLFKESLFTQQPYLEWLWVATSGIQDLSTSVGKS